MKTNSILMDAHGYRILQIITRVQGSISQNVYEFIIQILKINRETVI